MTNKEYATKDTLFTESVKLAQFDGHKVQATGRQASKFRRHLGIAYRYCKQAIKESQGETTN